MRSAAAAALAAATLAGCSAGGGDAEQEAAEGYPPVAVTRFVEECSRQPGATEAACRCVIERLQETMAYDEFERADEALTENREPADESTRKLRAAAERCR